MPTQKPLPIKKKRQGYSVPLTPRQLRTLSERWNGFEGGIDEFAIHLYGRLYPNKLPKDYEKQEVYAQVKQLRLYQEGTRKIGKHKFAKIAEVLGTTPIALLKELSGQQSRKANAALSNSLAGDISARYRMVFHHYFQTSSGEDASWIYVPFDLSDDKTPVSTCYQIAYSPRVAYHASAIFGRNILTLMITTDEDGDKEESVHLFRDFPRILREPGGRSGVFVREDQNGVGGSLLFKQPFPGTGDPGPQGDIVSQLLSDYWSSSQIKAYSPPLKYKLKIISGGQTGADRSALDVAIAHSIPHGGWCPKGRIAENGERIPTQYKLEECESASYIERIEKNVLSADGTAIISLKANLSGGSKRAFQFAKRQKTKLLHIHQGTEEPGRKLAAFVLENRIHTLNVAGPRASQEPKVRDFVAGVLTVAIRIIAARTASSHTFGV